MSRADRAIRYSTIAAVSLAALVAAFVSYRHTLPVVRAHGESGALALAHPLTIDGPIYAASMVPLNAARQGTRAHRLAYRALGLGISATLATGLSYGPAGALVAAWPTPALMISYKLSPLVDEVSCDVAPEGTPGSFATHLLGVVLVVVAAQKPSRRGPATCTTTSRGGGGRMTTPLPARSIRAPAGRVLPSAAVPCQPAA